MEEPLGERWLELDWAQRRAIVSELIDRVDIAPTTRANNRFDQARVAVSWRV